MKRINQLYREIKQNSDDRLKYICLGVMLVMIITLGITLMIMRVEGTTQALSDKIIRFHVVANSDTTQDQIGRASCRERVYDLV